MKETILLTLLLLSLPTFGSISTKVQPRNEQRSELEFPSSSKERPNRSSKKEDITYVYYYDDIRLLSFDNTNVDKEVSYEIYNTDGNFCTAGYVLAGEYVEVDLSAFPKDTYLVVLRINGGEYCETIDLY